MTVGKPDQLRPKQAPLIARNSQRMNQVVQVDTLQIFLGELVKTTRPSPPTPKQYLSFESPKSCTKLLERHQQNLAPAVCLEALLHCGALLQGIGTQVECLHVAIVQNGALFWGSLEVRADCRILGV